MVTEEQCFKQHKDVNDNLNDIKISIAELPEKIFEKGSEKFASKLTEKIVYALVSVVLLAVASAITGLVVYAK